MKSFCLIILLLISPHIYSNIYTDIDTSISLNNYDNDTIIKNESNKAKIIIEEKISILLSKFVNINKTKGVEVYCIQIYNGNDRKEAIDSKYKFIRLFPNVNPVTYERINPNWKVRAGKFRTRLEAQKHEFEIKKYFQNCFISKTILKKL